MTASGKCHGMNWFADALNVEQIDRETTHRYTLSTLPTLLAALSPVQSGRVSNEDARSSMAEQRSMNPDRIARSGDVSGILDLIEPLVKSVAQSFSTMPAQSEPF